MDNPVRAVTSAFLGLALLFSEPPQSATGTESQSDSIRALIIQIDQDANAFDAERQRLQASLEAEQTRDPSEVDELVNSAGKNARVWHDLNRSFINFFELCDLRLRSLSALGPYHYKSQAQQTILEATVADLDENIEAQFSLLQRGKSAYHNQDADTWNSLVHQIAAGRIKGQTLKERIDQEIVLEKMIMEDAKDFLRKELSSTQRLCRSAKYPELVLDKRIIHEAEGFLDETLTRYHLSINNSYRTYEEQNEEYRKWIARGKTGNPVAMPGTSRHESGFAMDLNKLQKLTFNDWNNVLNIGERHGFSYLLGDWPDEGHQKFDWPHFEADPRKFGESLEQSIAKSRTSRNAIEICAP